MDALRIVLVGPGRAGLSILTAAIHAGHHPVGVLARNLSRVPASLPTLSWDQQLPECDLLLLAVRDDAIAAVAERLAPHSSPVGAACHLSGFARVEALAPLGERIGCLHPLQTLPDPEVGWRQLAGAWAAVTSPHPQVAELLGGFAASLGMRPFPLADDAKPAYHAAAAAASNFLVAALAVAHQLFGAAGVSPEVARPLSEAIVDNVYRLGAEAALTGPIARGDVGTVAGQLAAADAAGVGASYRWMARATAAVAGTSRLIEPLLGEEAG